MAASDSTSAADATAASPAPRGAFILFEGVDRCGKTTQGQRLVETMRARGLDAEFLRFPDRTTAIGKIINQYLVKEIELEDHAVHLLFAANRWECAKRLTDGLKAGKHMVVDRYSQSGIAFSAAKPGMSVEWCSAPEAGLPAPDVVIFLQLDATRAANRGGFGSERYERSEFQKIVRENYRKMQHSGWRFVDAAGTIEEVAGRVEAVAFDTVAGVGDKPIGVLWDNDDGEAAASTGAVEERKSGMEDAQLAAAKERAAALIRGTTATASRGAGTGGGSANGAAGGAGGGDPSGGAGAASS